MRSSLEDGSKFSMKITLEVDFDYKNKDGEEIKPEYLENQFRHALNDEIHTLLLNNEEFMMWTMQKFRDLTGFYSLDNIHDLGEMHLKVTKMKPLEDDTDELERLKEIADKVQHSIDSQWDVPAFEESIDELYEFIEEMEEK